MQLALALPAILLYLICTQQIWRRLRRRAAGADIPCGRDIALLWIGALVLHGLAIYTGIASPDGLTLGITHALSLVGWLVALLVLIALHSRPVENLGLILLPFAALTLAAETIFPGSHVLDRAGDLLLAVHIFISLLAYSLFVIAALQSGVLWLQDRQLRNHRPGALLRALPPLEHTETVLFQIIGLGFLLLTVAIVSGFVYISEFPDAIQPQQIILFTIFLCSWVIFATLLLGRWRFGWRGRIAIRWTLSGFLILLLAYFGTEVAVTLLT
ncbi:cytochrome C assembly family protein [Acidihalobacter prosperus]|uniref:Cytochrome c assembly protein domain-containing protein n=1 Tax=Acidihalobacter prosperus TaxID=160660 RepID=A0A1A6C5R8_9GAMM|nr:cytochrome c biogenesis protein CcsA [Acidihalobacter prosperus]OBS09908.1 hypothetical protein Thpro_020958 [Acidihalobacter prosperus]